MTTHFVVRNEVPQAQPEVVGRLYSLQPVLKTEVPDYAPNFIGEAEAGDDVPEAKVVTGGRRGRRPKAAEVAETK